MAGPTWLAGVFAAIVILAGAYSASRLAVSRLRARATESDADALHAVMGAAMAGMLVPRLRVLPGGVWMAVFGLGVAWFGWQALRARAPGAAGSPGRFPVPHLIECVAMLYMLLPVDGGLTGSFPALAVVLALFMLGYIVWTTDRLTALVRTGPGSVPASAVPRHAHPAGGPVLAPKLAACGKLAMSIAMGYMLVLML